MSREIREFPRVVPSLSASSRLLEAALDSARRGWAVFPLHAIDACTCTCGNADCDSPGKHPRTPNGFKAATRDPEQIATWWRQWPDANIGIATGATSDLLVLDVDPRHGGDDTLADLIETHGALPDAVQCLTGGGGLHVYFEHPGGHVQSRAEIARGIDVRADGGYVVAPPSTHASGRPYAWDVAHHPDDVAITPVPAWLLELIEAPVARGRVAARNDDGRIPEGCRNDHLASLAGSMRRRGMSEPAILAALLEENRQRCDPPLGELEVGQIARSIARYAPGPAAASSPGRPEVLVPGAHLTANAEYVEIGNDRFAGEVLQALPKDVLYRRGPLVGTLEGEPGELRFEEIDEAGLRLLVDAHIRLVKWSKPRNGLPAKLYVPCSTDHARLIRAAAGVSTDLRSLELLTPYPVVIQSDYSVIERGWNAAARAFYDEPEALRVIPRIRSVDRIHEVLDDLVVDFPFKDEASRQNFYGLLLTPLVRAAMPEANVPFHLVVSSLERTGKGKLAAETFGGVVLGRTAPVMPWAASEEERDKRLTALLKRGTTIAVIDNLDTNESLDSAVLASLVTGRQYTGRLLGKSEMIDLPNTLTLVATGNNTRCSGEIAKRTIPILLQPTTDSPETRTDFRHPDVVAHVREARPAVLGALLGMVENWKRDRHVDDRTMGGFEQWSRVVGGILYANGLAKWRSNCAAWVRHADPDGEDLRAFVAAWADRWIDERRAARDLLPLAEELGVFPWVHKAKNDSGKLVSFAKTVLRRHENRPVGQWVIRASGSGSMSLYYLEGSKP